MPGCADGIERSGRVGGRAVTATGCCGGAGGASTTVSDALTGQRVEHEQQSANGTASVRKITSETNA